MALNDVGIRISAHDDTQPVMASVQRRLGQLNTAASTVSASLAGLGVGISAAGFVAFTKNIIDGVDALNDLKDATGASIENISALEDVARRSGTGLDTVSTALVKMNQALSAAKPGSDTERAINALGLSVKQLKALDPALAFQGIAQALSGYADDANKARLVQELFGKSLKDVAPLLKDTAEAGQLVATVTTEQAEAAERLNKQFFALQAKASNAGRVMVAELLPTLNTLGDEFLKADTAGGSLAKTLSGGIKVIFETVAILGANVSFVLESIGRELGAIAAQLVAIGKLDFAGFSAISEAVREDGVRARKELDELERRILGLNSKGGAGRGVVNPAAVNSAPSLGGVGGPDKAAAAAALRELEAQKALVAELAGLTSSFSADWGRLNEMFEKGRLSVEQLTAAQAALLEKQPAIRAEAKALEDAQRDAAKQAQESAADYAKALEDQESAAEKIRDQVAAERLHVQSIGETKEAVAALVAQRLDEQALTKERLADYLTESGLSADLAQSYRTQAQSLRDLAALKRAGAAKEAAQDLEKEAKKAAAEAAAEWQKAAEKIQDSITDSLMRGFESGKGFAENLRDTVVNMFKTLVLRPVVELGVRGSLSALGIGGLSGAANAADATGLLGGGSGLLSTAITYGKVFGGALVDGWGAALAGNATGAIGGLSSVGTGAASTAYGLGTAVGAVAPYVLAALAVKEIASGLNGGSEYTTGSGISGRFSEGGFSGRNYKDWQNDGSKLFGISVGRSSSGTNYSSLDSATQNALGQTYGAIITQTAAFATTLGANADSINGYQKDIRLALGADAEANKKAIADMFKGLANEVAATVVNPRYIRESEGAADTLARLSTSITTANAWLSILRQRLFQVSLAGGDAASSLADAFGGLDKLTASSKAFYDSYYTDGEKLANSQRSMTEALAGFNLALPVSKDAFRELAETLDLNTDSGRAAYATLLQLAPEFAATADLVSKAAKATSDAMLKAFTGNGVVPALDATAISLAGVQAGASVFVGSMAQVHAVMLDANSPIITFNGYVATLSTELTGAQVSAGQLKDQIETLGGASGKAVLNIAGLSTALESVSTEVFVNTIVGVFENLATRIGGVIDDITAERVAVREAALQIINPTVLSKAQIQSGIAGIDTALPVRDLSAVNSTALAAESASQALLVAQDTAYKNTAAFNGATAAKTDTIAFYEGKRLELQALAKAYSPSGTLINLNTAAGNDNAAYKYNAAANQLNGFDHIYSQGYTETLQNGIFGSVSTTYNPDIAGLKADPRYKSLNATLSGGNTALANAAASVAAASTAMTAAQATLATATAAKAAADTAAAEAAKKAALDYAAALQSFAIDASKSVGKLTRLREETVKYYEAQKQLADLMNTSAAGLRTTVDNYNFGQKTPEQQLAELQGKYASAYTTALSVQGDGNALAGQGDKLNALLGPLIDKLTETGKTNLIGTYLTQAQSIADLLEANAPQNYQQDSLAMLGSIDATLAALDASSQSAERIISNAVNAGAEKTASGLRAVIAAITGNTIPAFATGGYHAGGLRIVGENGPELEATGPSHIFNASQTRSMMGGGDAVVAELRALRADNDNMRAELRAIAVASNKTAKILERVTPDGNSLQTVAAV